jgi:hypothetical protein
VTTPEIQAVMQASMDVEDRRRELASQTPGVGSLMQLPQPPSGPGVGLSDVALPHVGEGYDHGAPLVPQSKAYGPDPLIGGLDYAPLDARPAMRHLADLGERVFAAQDRAADPYTVISPPAAKPGLLARLAAKLRRK